METELPVHNMQATFTSKEFKEIEQYLLNNNIRSKRAWLRQITLKEVRQNNDKPL